MVTVVTRREADLLPHELAERRAEEAQAAAKMQRRRDDADTAKRQAEANAANEKAVWEGRDAMLAQIAADRTTILDLQQRTANLEEAIVEILKKEVAAPITAPTASRERRGIMSRIMRNFVKPKD